MESSSYSKLATEEVRAASSTTLLYGMQGYLIKRVLHFRSRKNEFLLLRKNNTGVVITIEVLGLLTNTSSFLRVPLFLVNIRCRLYRI